MFNKATTNFLTKKADKKLSQKKQQWSKAVSNHFAMKLAMYNPDSPLKKAYDNTFHCNTVKQYDGEKMKSTYCKNRWCYTCNRIRTAININNYSPQIGEFEKPYFVTLTRPTCTIEELPEQIKNMEKRWRLLYQYSTRKSESPYKKGIRLIGIRKMECTLSHGEKYHYHFHLIVDGKNNAEWIRSEWLKRNHDSSPDAQDVRPADKGALMEVFKYTTKMSVKMDDNTDFKRLDLLFQAMRGKRTLSTFGGIKSPKKEAEEDFDISAQIDENLQLRFGNNISVWKWQTEIFDWLNFETGELLIGEELPQKIRNIIEEKPYTKVRGVPIGEQQNKRQS